MLDHYLNQALRINKMTSTTYPKSKTAIIIVDPYNDFMSWRGKLWPLLRKVSLATNIKENLQKIVAAGRGNDLLIAYAPHRHYVSGQFADAKYLHPSQVGIQSFRVFEKGSFGGRFYDALVPQPGDVISSSHKCSSGFAETDLHEQLAKNGITHIVIIGYTSNTCVEATARSAVDLDYHVTLITDAVASWTSEDHHAAVGVNYKALASQVTTTEQVIKSLKNQE
jgi:nicotinamidase-related amidase